MAGEARALRQAAGPDANHVPTESRTPTRGLRARPWWPGVKRAVTFAFFALVAWLIVDQARTVEWDQVLASMRRQPLAGLAIAGALAACSHALFSTFDLLGRRTTGHRLPVAQVWTVNFVSYAFNLNLGSLVGGFALRYRLYARLGLSNAVITEVVAVSMLSNWLGYLLVGGLAFASGLIEPPANWKIGADGLQTLGAVLIAVAVAYAALCAFSKRRRWTLRGHELTLPGVRFALLQLAMSSTNWLLMGGVVFMLLQQRVAYPLVLAVLLVAAIAGVATHVPAGLGVLEAVFIALLSPQVPRNELLGALLAYRAIYYLAPLAVATVVYLVLETRARRLAAANQAEPPPSS